MNMACMMLARIKICVNGREIELKEYHASITDNGFNNHGGQLLNSGETRNEAAYILFDLSVTPVCTAGTYTQVTDTTHQQYYLYTSPAQNWTGVKVLITNTASPTTTDIVMQASWAAIALAAGDLAEAQIQWVFDAKDFTSDGLIRWGNDCFNNATAYNNTFNYMALLSTSTEVMRTLGVYSLGSTDNIHNLEFDLSSTYTGDEIRIYNTSTGGQYCYSKSGEVQFDAGAKVLRFTLSNPQTRIV